MLEVTARSAADILEIQPNSAALFYRRIWEVLVYHLEQESHESFDGVVELDESYFGGIRKGKRGRDAVGKVYTRVVGDNLMPLMTRKIAPDSIVAVTMRSM